MSATIVHIRETLLAKEANIRIAIGCNQIEIVRCVGDVDCPDNNARCIIVTGTAAADIAAAITRIRNSSNASAINNDRFICRQYFCC